jgi:hypothetical protein
VSSGQILASHRPSVVTPSNSNSVVLAIQYTTDTERTGKRGDRRQKATKANESHELNYLIPTLEQTLPLTQGKPIRWLLLSTLSIRYFEQAWQCVRGYGFRWLIERFHFTLKRGCHLNICNSKQRNACSMH